MASIAVIFCLCSTGARRCGQDIAASRQQLDDFCFVTTVIKKYHEYHIFMISCDWAMACEETTQSGLKILCYATKR